MGQLLVDLGAACSKYQDETIRNIRSKRLPCDEMWSFVGSKQKNTSEEKKAQGCGDCWTWTALDADTKLIVSFRLGDRTLNTADDFMHDRPLAWPTACSSRRTATASILEAVESAFTDDIDYAMLTKIYQSNQAETRYSPAVCIGCETKIISGNPDVQHVSTSYVERQNLTMRMSMRRFTRLTNAFSKKMENHAAMVALYFMYYNFARVHQTLRVTPAMEAGIADHVWSINEIVGLLEEQREQANAVEATANPASHPHCSGGARVIVLAGLVWASPSLR